MIKLMFNKSLWVASAFCALAMNINTARGVTEAEFNVKHDRLIKDLIPLKEKHLLSETLAKCVAQGVGFPMTGIDEAYSICYLLCLDCSPDAIRWLIGGKGYSAKTIIDALKGEYEDLAPDMHEILGTFSEFDEEWKLDLSVLQLASKDRKSTPSECAPPMYFVKKLIRGNNSLTVLLLNDNKMGDHTIAPIFEALRDNPYSSLKKIDLSRNRLKDYGAEAIAETLRKNTNLSELVLVGCEIGDRGAMALGDMLKINTTLFSIDMRKNPISTTAIEAFADIMENNITITDMKLPDIKY